MAQITTPTTIIAGAPLGTTVIVDPVVAKIAGLAAREVPGVFALGGGATRLVGVVRDALNATDLAQGVKVEVGDTEVAVDLTIVVEYPQPLQQVADAVRTAVSAAVTGIVGMKVAEINVTVSDVHIAGEDSTETETRLS